MTTKSTEPAPRPDRAERAQPSGYTPPAVGAPTWPRMDPETAAALADQALIEAMVAVAEDWMHGDRVTSEALDMYDRERIARHVAPRMLAALPPVVREQVNDLRTDRDRLRAVIAAAYVDLLAGRVDEAIAGLRVAGEQP